MAQYDAFAEFYNRDWGVEYHAQLEGVLDRLLLPHLSLGDSILDVGCGSGQVAAHLSSRGFRVTGVDESEAMLSLARVNAPGSTFIEGDARTFTLEPPAVGSIATFETLNHILDPVDLESALIAMAESTSRISVFDLLAEVAYNIFWNGTGTVEQGGEVCEFESHFDVESRIARCRVSVGGRATTITERCYDFHFVDWVLRDQIGYKHVHRFDGMRELGMRGDIAVGRVFYQCLK
jgi:SAM-dependent methyltransferase